MRALKQRCRRLRNFILSIGQQHQSTPPLGLKDAKHAEKLGLVTHVSTASDVDKGPSLSWLQAEKLPGKREGVADGGPTVALSLARSHFEVASLQASSECSPKPAGEHKDTTVPPQSHSYVPSQRQTKLISLVGRRCVVQCQLDNVPVEALWDTGAQASLINEEWRKKHLLLSA